MALHPTPAGNRAQVLPAGFPSGTWLQIGISPYSPDWLLEVVERGQALHQIKLVVGFDGRTVTGGHDPEPSRIAIGNPAGAACVDVKYPTPLKDFHRRD